MSEEFRSMIAAAAALQEDEASFESITAMAVALRCESTEPIDDSLAPDAPRALRELVEWCKEQLIASGLNPVEVMKVARVAAVRSTAHLELWIARRCGAMRRGGYVTESANLLARGAAATSLLSADWADADALAAQPWLLESIDGNVAGMIFNNAARFDDIPVRDVLLGWVLSLALNASREQDVGRALAMMSEAGQALNYAGFMDGWEGGKDAYRESATATQPAEFATAAAKRAADARHAENRSMKAEVFAWLDAHRSEYRSMEAAAVAIANKVVPMSPRTVRAWISDWHKGQ